MTDDDSAYDYIHVQMIDDDAHVFFNVHLQMI